MKLSVFYGNGIGTERLGYRNLSEGKMSDEIEGDGERDRERERKKERRVFEGKREVASLRR